MKTMYIAAFKYGGPNLAQVEIVKETSKTVTIARASYINLIGWQYFGKRTPKSKINIFPNKREAMLCLLEKAKVYAEQCREAVIKADEVVEALTLAFDE